jgi:hypothetical protein
MIVALFHRNKLGKRHEHSYGVQDGSMELMSVTISIESH